MSEEHKTASVSYHLGCSLKNFKIMLPGNEICISYKESGPYPSGNAKPQIDVMFLRHSPTYDNASVTMVSHSISGKSINVVTA